MKHPAYDYYGADRFDTEAVDSYAFRVDNPQRGDFAQRGRRRGSNGITENFESSQGGFI
jgi:hypothetical protein